VKFTSLTRARDLQSGPQGRAIPLTDVPGTRIVNFLLHEMTWRHPSGLAARAAGS